MKTSPYTDSQIMAILKEAEAGTPVPQLCREHGMSSATFYKWRARYGGMDTSMMAHLQSHQPAPGGQGLAAEGRLGGGRHHHRRAVVDQESTW